MRRLLLLLVLLAVLGGGFWFVRSQQAAQTSEMNFDIIRRATIGRDRIQATVNATGTIEPEAQVTLTFGAGGTVQSVMIVRGQLVQAGEVLATLDTAELALAVQQAQDALEIQRLTRAQRLNSAPSPATLASAQADIDAAAASLAVARANLAGAEAARLQAQAQKAQLLAGPTAAELASAEAEIAARTAELEVIQDSYDRIIQAGIAGVPEEQTRFQLFASQQALAAAEARLETLRAGPRRADIQAADAAIASADANVLAAEGNIASAEAGRARAQAAYERLLEPPTADEIAILEAQIQSAATNLALAELRLKQAQIIAPIAGRVASVAVHAGELASPGTPVITLLDEKAFHIDVNVDEIDIDQVETGQHVAISLDALPNLTVDGVISEIAPTAALAGGGVVSYLVTINIVDAGGAELRPGMSANAAIVVEEIDDVLIVPNWAVRLDRETGQAFVNRLLPDGRVEEIAVETGLRNEQVSQVVAGLNAGDEVVITSERETFSFFGGGGQ